MKITGTVYDVTDNSPLGGASIQILNPNGTYTQTGTMTTADGTFSLDSSLLDVAGAKVEFSFIGYDSVKLDTQSAQGDIYLSRTGDSLGAVIVTAKNKLKKNVLLTTIVMVVLIVIMIVLFSKLFKTSIINAKN